MDLSKKFKNSISYRALTVARSNKSKEAFILTATMLTLASCGGGGGGGSGSGSGVISPSQPSSNFPNITGTVVKGPLHNALVFADYNNDGLLSAGEPSTRTAADGSFVLNSDDPSANFVSISDSQTTDSFTGENVSGIGASTKGNVILQYCELDDMLLSEIGEVNKEKFGHKTPGSWIPIISEQEVLNKRNKYLLILPWHFKDFFLQNKKFKNKNLIFPLPRFEIIKN